MSTFPLHPHPSTPSAAVRSIEVAIGAAGPAALSLRYTVHGDIAGLRIPPPATPARADGLWRQTCCEVFLRRRGQPGYAEWNLAPSGAWAAYRFAAYRSGMAPLPDAAIPRITVHAGDEVLAVAVTVGLEPPLAADVEPVDLALSAVMEDGDGRLSYWALRHGPGQPDFHDAGSFALALRLDRSGALTITRI